jgi:MFS family permease
VDRRHSLDGRGLLFLLFFCLLWFLNYSGRAAFAPILPLLEDEFNIKHAEASSIIALMFVGYSCALFFSAVFSNYFGSKKALLIYLIASGATCLCMPLVKSFGVLYLLGIIFGMATGLYMPNAIIVITEYYSEKVWGKVICIHDSAVSIAVFVMPLVALFFLSLVSWSTMFALLAIPYFVCAAICAWKVEQTKGGGPRRLQMSLMKKKSLWLIGTILAFASGSYLGIYFIIPLYLTKELKLDLGQALTTFGVSRLGGAVVAIAAGFMADRFSLKRTALAFLVTTGVLTMSLALKNVNWVRRLLFVQATIAPAFLPLGLVIISRIFPKEERGQATGFIATIGAAFGMAVIPFLLGLCGDLISFRAGIFTLGLLTALSGGLLLLVKEEY